MKGCLYFLLAVVIIVGIGILLPAWLLQIVLGAFDINIDLWVCILIFVLLNMVGGMFKGSWKIFTLAIDLAGVLLYTYIRKLIIKNEKGLIIMETVYTRAIETINIIFTGNQEHIQKGNEFFIRYLDGEVDRVLRKFNNKQSRLDSMSLTESLHLILNYMDNKVSKECIQDKLVRKHVVRIANVLLENIKHGTL